MQTVLVIDDNAAFREAIALAGEDLGWCIQATDDLAAIADWLSVHDPDVVLLDWNLVGHRREDYLALLQEQGLTGRTLLLSALMDDARKQVIRDYNLAGYRLKPLDLDHLADEIRLPEGNGSISAEAVMNDIDVAIDILDDDLRVRWSNAKARKTPLTPAQFLILKWLRIALLDSGDSAARRLDWDGEAGRFLESRMFRAETQQALWVARDWRSERDPPHDHELLSFERDPTRQTWLRGVARLLAQRYAISRLRVYKIAGLPATAAFGEKSDALVIPLFQSGGGFATSEQDWRHSGYLASDNDAVNRALQTGFTAEPEFVGDLSPNRGCQQIRYGADGTSRVVFPVSHKDAIPAVFALDRRLDHLQDLRGFDRAVVETARRMASDEAGPLSQLQWRMMHGLVNDIGVRLADLLDSGETRRSQDWHERIGRALRETYAEQSGPMELTYDGLSRVCALLLDAWKDEQISGRILGTSPFQPGENPPPLDAWYIASVTGDGRWYPVAGAGEHYGLLCQSGEQPLADPHRTALAGEAWQPVAVQDFQAWLRRTGTAAYDGLAAPTRAGIAGWAAVPMQVDGKVTALLVVHAPHRHYFTEVRLRLLQHAAAMLLPQLAAARRETLARSAFTAAVMHEVKNDAHQALLAFDTIRENPGAPPEPSALIRLGHYLEGLEAVGQDSLDVFQLGRRDRVVDSGQHERRLTYRLGSLLDAMVNAWKDLYFFTELTFQVPPADADRWIEVPNGLAFRRAVRVLLHNAFRHGRDWVRLDVRLERDAGSDDGARLCLDLRNPAARDVLLGLAEDLGPTQARIPNSPLARGRMGLAAAKQLCLEAGAYLAPLAAEEAAGNADRVVVHTALHWPVRIVKNPTPEAS